MNITLMKSKIHRATVTQADLSYEGSVSIDPKLIEAAGLFLNEKVDILNCNNGERFSTYVIEGRPQEVCLNGAAARLVQPGDVVIIVSYLTCDINEAKIHKPQVVFVDQQNRIKELRLESHKFNTRDL
ncbi:MAG: aspartate 1-decarboxylase [Bdellovibrionota bacterium]